ncbi:putative TWiK family of potassium channels protein 7-like [Apostichopus japonicus]|uniref:Putative TWiK family of potassium channels protein 7-like n=1 Tax=Stichopus japonicus TaxID=307972 RepID=A0A2G8LHF5_STIJA|nr:putative TWiK family of potassium channels protein 7-like [Apostichopus japonicus]
MACLSPRTTALLKLSVPHVALVIFYFSYLFAGSLLFHFLENTSEKKAVAQFDNREESLREEIKTLLMNCSEAAPEQATLLDTLLQELVDTVTHPDWEGGRYDVMESGNEWSISSSLLFCFTTITTIGYGVSVPATTMGKIAVVIYSAIGVPLSFLLFADMGGLLARLASFIASSIRLRCRGDNNAVEGGNDDGIFDGSTTSPVNKRESRIILQKQPSYLASVLEEYDNGNVPFPVIILFIVSYMCIGALSFSLSEGWSYLEAFYFTFITLTTIGFGDFYPIKHIENNSLFPCMIYTLVGLCCLSMCITLLQARFIKLVTNIKSNALSITKFSTEREAGINSS